jgi:hypothetical protein
MTAAAPAPHTGALTLVASIGTAVGCIGVFHALFDRLRGDGAPLWLAIAEGVVVCLFLEGVVVVCAGQARAAADGSRVAKLYVTVVLAAAAVSGAVSGLHAGWTTTAGLLRFAVPVIAAVVWLGDIVHVLRTRARDDHEQLLRRVVLAAGKRKRMAGKRWLGQRAETRLVKAINGYEADGGDPGTLVARLERVHHMGDLLRPLGPSPWRPQAPFSVWPRLPAPDAPDTEDSSDPDPLLPVVKALVAADPWLGRPRLLDLLRKQGHQVGSTRAGALLRTAREGAPGTRVNGTTPTT